MDGDAVPAATVDAVAVGPAEAADNGGALPEPLATAAERPEDLPPGPPAAVRQLARRLQTSPDVALRLRQVARWVGDTAPSDLAAGLQWLGRHTTSADLRAVWVTFALWLLHARPRPQFPVGHWPQPVDELAPPGLHLALAAEAAWTAQHTYAHHLLRDAFARPTAADDQLLPLHPSVEKWPLGWRRERARGLDRNQLQLLLLDTTPAVVQVLAENPRILEPHAVQMASLRGQHPAALQSLLMVPRWLGNDKVCEAVVRNQSAPSWLVLLLAPLLPTRTQQALVHVAWLQRPVRHILGAWHGITAASTPQGEVTAAVHEVEDPGELDELLDSPIWTTQGAGGGR
jgi:hypothetical protein